MNTSTSMLYLDPNLLSIVNTIAVLLAEITTLVVGYLLVRLGFELIRDGAKGDFNFTGDLRGIKLGLASVSPGTLFALLGAVVIVVTLIQHRSVNTTQRVPNPHLQAASGAGASQARANPLTQLSADPPPLNQSHELPDSPPSLVGDSNE
jgi:hypothetical protein